MVFLKDLKNILGIMSGAAIIAASVYFCPLMVQEKKVFMAPPPHLEFFSFGFQSTIADNLWIRSIQDIDYCENRIAQTQCAGNSWVFQMLDAITNLAPDYLAAYADGGVTLSVIVGDSKGASRIFDKGVAVFQNNFSLLYRAGLHAFYDEKNLEKAAGRFLAAARLQGLDGTWLYSLASRLYVDAGKREVAMELYRQVKQEGLDESYLKRIREKLGIKDE